MRVLPESWNSQGPSCYAFRYSHPQSSMTFVIKSLKLGNRFIIHGIAIEVSIISKSELKIKYIVYTIIYI